MNALTYDLRSAAATSTAAAPAKPQKGLFARFFDALIEARMREAERQIRQHIHFVPENVLRQAGYKADYQNDAKLPFVK
jgi:hypothetical protein